MCRIHKDEKVKLFCKDCRMAICTVCCSIKHRKCDDVETIDVMMPIVKEAMVNETRIQEKKIQAYTENISGTDSTIEELTTKAQEMKDQVRNVRMAATDVLLRKEKELVDRIDNLTEYRVQKLKSYRQNQATDLQMEQQRYEFTYKAVTSDCVSDMFGMYESVDGVSTDEEGSDGKKQQASSFIFVHGTEMLMRSADKVQFGEVKVVCCLNDRRSSPFLLEPIDFSGYTFHDLRDVVIFVVDGIKVTPVIDYLNWQLSTHFVPKIPSMKKYLQHFQLASGPMGIAKVGGTKASVALPDTQQIAFIKFDPEPTLQSTVKTKRKYCGLAFLNPAQLVAGTFDCQTSIDILDMEGNVLKSINTGNIRNPCYIHVMRNNNVSVSEGAVKSLVSVTVGGQAVFTFTPRGNMALNRAQGIISTGTGDILLVDKDSNKVIQLTESGQFVRDVLTQKDGLRYPIGICLDDDALLYVSSARCVRIFGFD